MKNPDLGWQAIPEPCGFIKERIIKKSTNFESEEVDHFLTKAGEMEWVAKIYVPYPNADFLGHIITLDGLPLDLYYLKYIF